MYISGHALFNTSTALGSTYGSVNLVDYVAYNNKPHYDRVRKLAATSSTTGLTTTVVTGYKIGRQMEYETASAYIESLSDEQLAAFEMKLEDKVENSTSLILKK